MKGLTKTDNRVEYQLKLKEIAFVESKLKEVCAKASEWEWFFTEYNCIDDYNKLKQAITDDDMKTILSVYNKMWFDLPDGRFNIVVNPKGWQSFLQLGSLAEELLELRFNML